MVLDGLRGYLQLANGLTDVTRERARAAAKALAAQGEAGLGAVVPGSVRALADDLLTTSRANRGLLVNLVRDEVERSVARLGLVPASSAGAGADAAGSRAVALQRRVEELEEQLRNARSANRPAVKKSAAKKSAAKKSAAKKSAAKKSATP